MRLSAEDFERHYRANEGPLRASLRVRLTNELDVEDCLNRVFEKLWSLGGRLPPAAVRSWLWIVARNEAAAIGRAVSRRSVVESTAGRQVEDRRPAGGSASPLDGLLHTEELERLAVATQRLPAEQAEVLRMRFFEDLSFREIAAALGIPIGTALTRARTGLMKLKREFENRE